MSSNKMSKGKPITTSVPSFAIRFHANGEELEELYPSEEEDKLQTEEKCSENIIETSKQESSPMRDYLNKFGKRSSSIDTGINDTTQVTSNDPWRIFSEFKGKLTKTVEEKLSEIKSKSNDNENSPKFSERYKNSKDNSSISDSEEHSISECSAAKGLTSTAEDIEMSSDEDCSVENDRTPTAPKMPFTLTSEVRNRHKAKLQITYKKDQEEIQLKTITNEREIKTEDYIESGIEAIEDNIVKNEPFISTIILNAPEGFVDLRPRIKKIQKKAPWRKFFQMNLVLLVFILLYYYPVFMVGFIFGLIAAVGIFFVFYSYIVEDKTSDNKSDAKDDVPIMEIPAVKEYQPVTKFEGWVNEFPEIYSPYTYHISMTQSVYLKLESNILRISHTNSKISKRGMWNEPKLNVNFTYHRVYNLRGAEIILLPRGLIHKRIWSKKYPICVILNKDIMHTDLPNKKIDKEESDIEDLNKKNQETKLRKNSDSCENIPESVDEDKTEVDDNKDVFEKDDDESITEDWDTLNLEENSTETKIYLFGRTGRDKEDWFRRLTLASKNTQEAKPNESKDDTNKDESDTSVSSEVNDQQISKNCGENPTDISESLSKNEAKDEEEEYLEYMARLGQVKRETLFSPTLHENTKHKHSFFRRKKDKHVQEDEVDTEIKDKEKEEKPDEVEEHQWFNVLIGRIIFDMNKNQAVIANIQERIQKKLSTIKLPYFIEEIVISQLNLGTVSPHFHKIYPASLDERGLWIDMDITYEGLIKMSLVTKLNLMKLKEQAGRSEDAIRPTSPNADDTRSPMFYSDIEDSAESSSDDEGVYIAQVSTPENSTQDANLARDAKGKKFLRMIDNIASSSLFQQATENKYIKRAMEGVSKTELKLTVEIRNLDGTLAINISAPPSDRIWLGFRGNPKLHLSAKPAFGERSINFAHVTRWIEKKLSQEFQKFLVMPNMEDFVCPVMNPNLPNN